MTTPATLTLTIAPTNLLTSNKRRNRHEVARITRTLRHAAGINARAAGIGPFTRAHVTVWIAWPDRRRRDALNLWPTIKACGDGFTDAGVWLDDDDSHLIGPDFHVEAMTAREIDPDIPRGVTRLRFEFEEVRE